MAEVIAFFFRVNIRIESLEFPFQRCFLFLEKN